MEFKVLKAEEHRGWVLMVKTPYTISPVGPRLLRGAAIDPDYLFSFYKTPEEAEKARAAWENYVTENYEKKARNTRRTKQQTTQS